MSWENNIIIVGAGRIGTSLGKRLRGKGLPIVQVVSRNEAHAEELAGNLRSEWTADFSKIHAGEAAWIILAVRDDAIQEEAAQTGAVRIQG